MSWGNSNRFSGIFHFQSHYFLNHFSVIDNFVLLGYGWIRSELSTFDLLLRSHLFHMDINSLPMSSSVLMKSRGWNEPIIRSLPETLLSLGKFRATGWYCRLVHSLSSSLLPFRPLNRFMCYRPTNSFTCSYDNIYQVLTSRPCDEWYVFVRLQLEYRLWVLVIQVVRVKDGIWKFSLRVIKEIDSLVSRFEFSNWLGLLLFSHEPCLLDMSLCQVSLQKFASLLLSRLVFHYNNKWSAKFVIRNTITKNTSQRY